jgi:Zn finger protein HypA/HybF involved in hydrogenase expression
MGATMTVITDPRYWDCECDDNFIHLKSNNLSCSECGMTEDECSDSRPNEIKLYYKNYKEANS